MQTPVMKTAPSDGQKIILEWIRAIDASAGLFRLNACCSELAQTPHKKADEGSARAPATLGSSRSITGWSKRTSGHFWANAGHVKWAQTWAQTNNRKKGNIINADWRKG
jgi:hypothetical protein